MKNLILILFIILSSKVNAEIQFLPLMDGSSFSASFPCTTERKTISSSIGVTNALQCRVDNGSSVCIYLTSVQPLDIQSFNKSGWKFIQEVNHQYALQMDRNYKNIYGKLVQIGGLGKAYSYEIIREQDGMQVNVKGLWMVSNRNMMRGSVSCAPSNTIFMKNESDLFLKSFTVIK
jgi:hypothetical protein